VIESANYFANEYKVLSLEYENGFTSSDSFCSLNGLGYYDVLPYFISKAIVDIPFILGPTVMYSAILLPMAGLQYEGDR
jgi:hypothetical protein